MQLVSLPTRGALRRAFAAVGVTAVTALAACGGGDSGPNAPPVLPPDGGQNPTFRKAAFIFDVNLRKGTVKVTPPEVKLDLNIIKLGQGTVGKDINDPDYSILSSDVIEISTSNFFASASGAIAPNRVRVFFDVQVQNRLPGIELITPTFPEAPAGQVGLLLFPYAITPTTTTGGVGTENGNEVVVELPSRGEAVASVDWNGSAGPDQPTFPALPGLGGDPFNFFNDASCTATLAPGTSSDCFRYETFGVIPGGGLSGARRVGFDIDATLAEFRVRMIAAADLRATGPGSTGTVNGTVTSPQRGALEGVTVTLQGVATPVVTNAAGQYSFANVGLGVRTVTLSTLPVGCGPASVPANGSSVTVVGGGTATLDYSVTCAAATGTINGTVNRTGTGTQSLAGISFTIDPDAVGANNSTGTVTGAGASVTFSAATEIGTGAGAGAGAITLGNLPANCTAPASTPYAGLTLGGSLAVTISVNCDTPPPVLRYRYNSRWTTPAAGSVDMIVSFDPSGFNDPNVNGAGPDGFASISSVVVLTGPAAARLTAITPLATGAWATPTVNPQLPTFAWLTNTTAGDRFALEDVATFRFTIGAGAAGTVTTATTISAVGNTGADEYTFVTSGAGQNLDITEATVTLP